MLLGDDIYSNGCKIRGLIVDKGTSFPGSPAAGQAFYRTDLATLNVWDGAAWQTQADTDYVDAAVAGVGGLTATDKTANYTAVAGDLVLVSNSTGSDIVIQMPATPADGDMVGVMLTAASGAGKAVVDGNGNSWPGGASAPRLGVVGESVVAKFNAADSLWLPLQANYGHGKFIASVGDAVSNPVTVSHGLGTLDVSVQVFENATGETVDATVIRVGVDDVTVTFASVASLDQYRVIVQG